MESYIILGAVLGTIPGYIASRKGHNFWVWWLYGGLFFILALPHSIVVESGTRVNAATISKLLERIESKPGQSQQELSLRAGLELPQVLGALTALHQQGMVHFEQTGGKLTVGAAGELVPEVRVFPS